MAKLSSFRVTTTFARGSTRSAHTQPLVIIGGVRRPADSSARIRTWARRETLPQTRRHHEKTGKKPAATTSVRVPLSFYSFLLTDRFHVFTAALLRISEAPPTPLWQVPRLQPQSPNGWLAAGRSQWSRNGGCIPHCRAGREGGRGGEEWRGEEKRRAEGRRERRPIPSVCRAELSSSIAVFFFPPLSSPSRRCGAL